eukprot:TRINITY_DN19461_c0_g2_i2.p1 TRINITY_DN19461_c0_g2~~TRINITY_DN19461_c0_g2_i2.p1  ORF type:complete len:313 (+),score=76.63 TRINITY_DN19461_c0_g2_i2:86-940(+)
MASPRARERRATDDVNNTAVSVAAGGCAMYALYVAATLALSLISCCIAPLAAAVLYWAMDMFLSAAVLVAKAHFAVCLSIVWWVLLTGHILFTAAAATLPWIGMAAAMGCAWMVGFVVLQVPLRHIALHKATPQQIAIFWTSLAIHSYALGHIVDGKSIYTEFFLLGVVMRGIAAQQATPPLAHGNKGRSTRRSASLPCPVRRPGSAAEGLGDSRAPGSAPPPPPVSLPVLSGPTPRIGPASPAALEAAPLEHAEPQCSGGEGADDSPRGPAELEHAASPARAR